MEIVFNFEKSNGRFPEEVHTTGVGYDILSKNQGEERHIEVKATSELWSTYTWLPLYKNEVQALKNFPDKFYLYIVKFDLDRNNRNEDSLNSADYELFIINGQNLLNKFKITQETYSLSPISRKKLTDYKQ